MKRRAAVQAGVIPVGYKGRFGWQNLRHSLARFFAANNVSPRSSRASFGMRRRRLQRSTCARTRSATKPRSSLLTLLRLRVLRN